MGGAMHPGSCSLKATLGKGGDRERPSSIPSLALKQEMGEFQLHFFFFNLNNGRRHPWHSRRKLGLGLCERWRQQCGQMGDKRQIMTESQRALHTSSQD